MSGIIATVFAINSIQPRTVAIFKAFSVLILSVSTKAYAGIINDEVVTIFGVASGSLLTGLGVPWLVGTDLLEQHQKTFLRRCKPILKQMLGQYPTLMNYVDERNHIAKAWLHWLGFQIEEAKPAGLLQLPFHRFTLRAK